MKTNGIPPTTETRRFYICTRNHDEVGGFGKRCWYCRCKPTRLGFMLGTGQSPHRNKPTLQLWRGEPIDLTIDTLLPA